MCDKLYRIKFFVILLIIGNLSVTSLTSAQENPEVKAIRLFNTGNFHEAEQLFQKLLEENPGNPMTNYYYGSSRTEDGHYTQKELECLMKAGKEVTPERLFYYLGVQYHARENWDQALKYYNKFRLTVPAAEQEELALDKKIQFCFNKINPFADASTVVQQSNTLVDNSAEPALPEQTKPEPPSPVAGENIPFTASNDKDNLMEGVESQPHVADNLLFLPREVLPNLPGVAPTLPSGDPIQFQVNNIITYSFTSQFQTEEGKSLFDKGRNLELQQKRNLNEADKLRSSYRNSTSLEEREAIAAKIIELETESYRLEEEIKDTYTASRNVENGFWEKAGPVVRNNFLMEQENIQASREKEQTAPSEANEEILLDLIEPTPKTPDRAAPADLVYKIQIGAYSKGVPAYRQRLYKKLSVIRTIENYTDENGIVVYTTGNLSRYEDALKMQNQVRQEGIEDARVVPYFNGKRITLDQAKQMEAKNDS